MASLKWALAVVTALLICETTWAVTDGVNSEYFDVLGTGRREWRLAFRGTAAIGKSVYDAYVTKSSPDRNMEPACKLLSGGGICSFHYRNSAVLDNWSASIEEVALVLLDRGLTKKYIVFDAAGSDNVNWMRDGHVKFSDWKDLTTQHNKNYFSLAGDAGLKRRFFINKAYGGCPSDVGWMVAVDQLHPPCHWEFNEAFPSFLYAPGDVVTNWTTGAVARADVLAVFVKYMDANPIG